MDRFLQLAQKLQLQGLLTTEEQEYENKKEVIDEQTIFEPGIVESVNMYMTRQTQEGKMISMNSKHFQSIEELDKYIEQQILKTDGEYKCYICNKTSKWRTNIKEHVEMMHIDGLSFDCSICGKTMSSKNTLRTHKSRICNKKELK